ERNTTVADHGGVKRLIQIVPRDRDPVLETLGNGSPYIVDNAECEVAVLFVVGSNYAGRDQVVDLLDHYSLLAKLFPKRIASFYPTLYLDKRNTVLSQLCLDGRCYLFKSGFQFGPTSVNLLRETAVLFRIEVLKGEVLELASHLTHAEPVSDRGVDIECFL